MVASSRFFAGTAACLPASSLPAGAGRWFPRRPCTHYPLPRPSLPAVGYRVFLGNGKYFVSSDVGGGKMQWYAFNKEPADGTGEGWEEKRQATLPNSSSG